MKIKFGNFLTLIRVLYLLYASFGLHLVLPGYLAGLAQGTGTLVGASQPVSGWKTIRYLLWAYSFILGMYIIVLSCVLRTEMSSSRKWVFGISGFIFFQFANIPLPATGSIANSMAGGFLTLMMLYVIWQWTDQCCGLEDNLKTALDYRMAGYLFLVMATCILCPIMSVKTLPCGQKILSNMDG